MYGENEHPHAECRERIKELESEVARCHRELEQASDRLLATAALEAEVERLRAQAAKHAQAKDSTWRIEYANDVGPNDDGFWEWWTVTDGTKRFRCDDKADARFLYRLLAGCEWGGHTIEEDE